MPSNKETKPNLRIANVGYAGIETKPLIAKKKQKKTSKDSTRLGEEGDPLGIVQKIEIWPYNQILYAQSRIRPREWDTQNSQGFWNTNRSPNPGQKTGQSDN